MIRVSEMVLAGHPDKFCDQVADAVIEEISKVDADAYGQVEVSTWDDRVWLSGGVCTRTPLNKSVEAIVIATGCAIGYTEGNWIDAKRYQIDSTISCLVGDPSQWSAKVNDQSIVVGWAGYDEKCHFLPPEHFLAHLLREALTEACDGGILSGEGPDGKLMVRMREEGDRWRVEHLLVTLQQRENTEFLELCQAVLDTLEKTYQYAQQRDSRWCSQWSEVETMINPNGPLLNGGSDGDNGQTGRKLVQDFFGPRIPIGGGALSGKHISHIDRIGAYGAREAAIRAVKAGAEECLVRLAFAPNRREPLDIAYEMTGRGERQQAKFFEHPEMVARYSTTQITPEIAKGNHFFDLDLPWNVP
jgi:S-adenosylmethionine synthetase